MTSKFVGNKIDYNELFENIKKRPGMYISEPFNVSNLSNFLTGYAYALNHYNIKKDGFFSCNPSFHDWVAMKENYSESTLGWAGILSNNLSSDEHAFNTFFLYVEAYLSRVGKVLYEYELKPENRNRAWRVYKPYDFRHFECEWTHCALMPYLVQIVSYDQSRQGVFFRHLDSDGTYLCDESYFCSREDALKYFLEFKKT